MTELEFDLPPRMVIIGDLNGQITLLERMLFGLRLITKNGDWRGGRTVLIQLGDICNRGPGARASMDLMMKLRPEAREAGGDALWLLGNHEVLSALQHEAYVTADEYMEFATDAEIDHFYTRRMHQVHEFLGAPYQREAIMPIGGRIQAWEEENAPGREKYRLAMGPKGKYGKEIRQLPIALRYGSLILVHAGISPMWASLGLAGLSAHAQRAWSKGPRFYAELEPSGILRDPKGPLWHRDFCFDPGQETREQIQTSLDILGGKHMVIGHTRTDAVRPSAVGKPLARLGDRLIMADVGLGEPGEPGSAIVIERHKMEVWSPGGSKSKLIDVKK